MNAFLVTSMAQAWLHSIFAFTQLIQDDDEAWNEENIYPDLIERLYHVEHFIDSAIEHVKEGRLS